MADVANTCPLLPMAITAAEAKITIKSMIQIGFRANLSRPLKPIYLLRHPADHRRTPYSIPKNRTNMISM